MPEQLAQHIASHSAEWLEHFRELLAKGGRDQARRVLDDLVEEAYRTGVAPARSFTTPYINTIPADQQVSYPGDLEIESRIESILRWNAMAMVVKANREAPGIGGHISSYASSATLFEVGFNHFFRGKTETQFADQIYIQGHTAPGIYARAFLEGRLSEQNLRNFRRELAPGGGLSSYPHPWLMPDFWQFPTVSMGLGPICAIYLARFNRYLRNRGILDTADSHVWAFLGDGEMDEPESLGALTLASRENLDNLIFVVNCNLQRLDGPVRGNQKIIQELEAAFRGARWNVLKVIWGSDWDPLLEKDTDNRLLHRMEEAVDGQYQKYSVEPGSFMREDFFGADEQLKAMVADMSDEQLQRLGRGGHDPRKVYAAYDAAVKHTGGPTVILAKTIKGYGLGEAGEGRNISHQQKKLNEEEMRVFRDRFDIPVSDQQLAETPFYKPSEDSQEMQYLRDHRRVLGGYQPQRSYVEISLPTPEMESFRGLLKGSMNRPASTTMMFGRLLGQLLRDKEIGHYIVPIVPDEARTFGLDALFRQYGIYSHLGQLYTPVDFPGLMYYREAKEGQIIEEGITEAGALSSFIAAGTAYATHDRPMIPFFIYYSMFGFQRVGDLIWAAADQRTKGFLLGATAGRTTLAGEGLQHQDGHSHLIASAVPNLLCYDPAFGYEVACIVREGIKRMYTNGEEVFYYLTLGNENYEHPAMPEGIEEGIVRGLYRYVPHASPENKPRVHLFGSGTLLNETLRAQTLLDEHFGVAADVWSVTSYKELRKDAQAVLRWNRNHPTATPMQSYLSQCLQDQPWPVVAVSDYVRQVPEMIMPYLSNPMAVLGTDGFGRSETREQLRQFFEVTAEHICLAALTELVPTGDFTPQQVEQAIQTLGIDPEQANPWFK